MDTQQSESIEPSAEMLATLRHMLGINNPRVDSLEAYRNYAAVNPGDPHYPAMKELGLVEMYRTGGTYDWWRCTPLGIELAVASARKRQHSRSKRRYRRFLLARDYYPELTFKQFLTDPDYADMRKMEVI